MKILDLPGYSHRICAACRRPTVEDGEFCMHCGAPRKMKKSSEESRGKTHAISSDDPFRIPAVPEPAAVFPPADASAESAPLTVVFEIADRLRQEMDRKRHRESEPAAFERRLLAFLATASRGSRIQLQSLHEIPIEPRHYQIESALTILEDMRGSGILADEVGLGKTIEAGLVLKEMLLRDMARRVLILVPASLVIQWRAELEEKFLLEVVEPESPESLETADGIFLISLARAKSSRVQEALSRIAWDLVIVDEAHALKNHLTQSHRFVFGLKRRHTLLLTATPVQNDLRELYNLVNIVSPGYFRSIRWFRRKFMIDRYSVREPELLRAACARVMVRHRRSDTLIQLPPRKVENIVVEPSEMESEFFDLTLELARRTMQSNPVEGEQTALILSILLKESTSSPQALLATLESAILPRTVREREQALMHRVIQLGRRVPITAKMRRLVEWAKSDSAPLIVYTEYIETLKVLRTLLESAGLRVHAYSGQMRGREKHQAIEAFRKEGGVLLSTEIGGQGLNLQHCHRMVNFDLPWNPMRLEQRIGRIHRFGQSETVHIVNITAAGTFEEVLMRVLLPKIRLFELVIGEIDSILAYLQNPLPLEQRIGRIILESPDMTQLSRRMEQLADEIQAAQAAMAQDQLISSRILDLPAERISSERTPSS